MLLAIRWRCMGTPLLFFLVFFFLALSPTSNLIVFIGSIKAERFLYLPSVGLAGCVVASIYALGLVCLAFTARTYARNFDWHDDLSLWTSAVAVCPEAARPHYNLALELEHLPGRQAEAIAEYRAALRLQPDFAEAHFNLGNALAKTPARLPEAIAEFEAFLRIRPDPQVQQMVDRLRAWQKQSTQPR